MKKSKSKAVVKKQNPIVFVDGSKIVTDSLLIAKEYGKEHKNVLRKIETSIEKCKKFKVSGLIFEPSDYIDERGKVQRKYLLNRDAYLEVAVTFTGDRAFQLRVIFIKAFNNYEAVVKSRQDHEWIETRTSGKVIRRVATDTMKEFIDYCFARGSKNAQRYYVSITKMMNASLFIVEGKFDNLREWMNTEQLKVVAIVEKIIDNALRDGMQGELPYKNVFKLAKARVINFSDLYGKTTIISTQPKQLAMF